MARYVTTAYRYKCDFVQRLKLVRKADFTNG